MSEEATCGTGMAASAVLPSRMSAVLAAMADMLTRHTDSLDTQDPAALSERDAWLAIAAEQRQLAGHLAAAADHMEAQRGLATAEHDVASLSSPDSIAAFEHFVHAQEQLNSLLSQQLVEQRAMLNR